MIDYYKLLELPPTAAFTEIKNACVALRSRLEGEILLGENIEALQSQLSLVVDAQCLLLDPDDREAYNEELASSPPGAITNPLAPKHFDFESIRVNDLDSWQDIAKWEGEATAEIYRNLLDAAVKLPLYDIQANILLAAILTPSALATAVPSVLSHGLPGCGKSQISNLVSVIWGTKPTLGNATFATLRRVVGGQSSAIYNGKKYFLNNALCWDDISPGHLAHEDKASLLKSSTHRATSIYKMPKKDTDNEFNEIETFGLRFFSSIYPFFADVNFTEMNRRMIVIQCEKSIDAVDTIDFETINWEGLESVTRSYWELNDGANSRRYSFLRKGIVTSLKKSSLSSDRATLCTDLLTTGLTYGLWKSNESAVKALTAFYDSNDELIDKRRSPLKSVLLKLIEGKSLLLACSVKDIVDSSLKTGLIDQRILRGELTAEMRLLGWELNVDDRCWEKHK